MPRPIPPQIRSLDIVAAQPEPADQRRLAAAQPAVRATGEAAVHLVKIYLVEELPITGQAYALYVGEEWVRKYFEFPGGIYFAAPDPEFLQRHQGDSVRFTLDRRTFVETDVKMPRTDLAEVRRRSMVVPRRMDATAEATPRLPTKREALRE